MSTISDNKSRFKMKKGEIEIEYEGTSEEVSSRFTEIFNWLKETPPIMSSREERIHTPDVVGEQKESKQDRRGGARSSVISPAIDGLMKEGFLKDFKTAEQVLEELKRKAVPVTNIEAVQAALARRVPKVLDRIKAEDGKWVYRKKS